jgi:hypothetical protein
MDGIGLYRYDFCISKAGLHVYPEAYTNKTMVERKA